MHINTIHSAINHPKSVLNKLRKEDQLPFNEMIFSDQIANHSSHISYRERIYTPEITILGFLSQAINPDQSCQAAVTRIVAYCLNEGKKLPSINTAAYSKARSRLQEEVLSGLAKETAEELEKQLPSTWLWRNKHIKLIDGSTISMADTLENQAVFPQSSSQKAGIGFPIARIVAVISYAAGSILGMAIGPYAGKETGETALLRQLMHIFKAGDIAIADCYYASYFMVALFMKAGIDVVFPIHQTRHSELRKTDRLGKKDHIVHWLKPNKPAWMDHELYQALPDKIKIREVLIQNHKPGYQTESRIIVTTFLDAESVSKDDLAELYDWRWCVEVDLRSIKDIMKMSILRGKTPGMVRKEIWSHVYAYNLIRKIMAQAADIYGLKPRLLSFKLTLQLVGSVCLIGTQSKNNSHYISMVKAVSQKKLNTKKRKTEPRRVKRRPKTYKLLMMPRSSYHQEQQVDSLS